MTTPKPSHPNDGTYCPLWRKPCVKVCHTCAWWQLLRGQNPQTGADMDQWGCAISHVPLLNVALIREQRGTTASVDNMRAEVHRNNDAGLVGAIARLNHAVGVGEPPANRVGASDDTPHLLEAPHAVR